MHKAPFVITTVVVVMAALPVLADDASPFVTTRVTDNVLVFTERTPWRSNHVVITTDRGLVLVDPGGSPAVARLLRQAIATELGHSRIAYVTALATYRELRTRPVGEVIFSEAEFNGLGYRLLAQGLLAEAIAVFELNVEAYPESWNVYDSLGEAHMLAGDQEKAIELYRRSLEINPDNRNGLAMLQRMGAGESRETD